MVRYINPETAQLNYSGLDYLKGKEIATLDGGVLEWQQLNDTDNVTRESRLS